MGTGPGASETGNFIADIEIRYTLGRGDSGVYTYCTFDHPAYYAATTITEARCCCKLADMFDWMSIADDQFHNKAYPSSLREGDKYIYTTNQFNNPAFGWSSTTKKVGFFFINPSMEYMSGGPTKIEFLGHRDTNQIAAPLRAELLALQPLRRGGRFRGRRRTLDQDHRTVHDLRELRRRFAGNLSERSRPGRGRSQEVAVRLGQRDRLSQSGAARHRQGAARADRPADAHSQNVERPRRSDRAGLSRAGSRRTRLRPAPSIGSRMRSTTNSGSKAPTTARSKFPTCAPAATRCTPSPTACSANSPRPT